MKRSITFVVALFVLGFANVGAAQTADPTVRMTMTQVVEWMRAQGVDIIPDAPATPLAAVPTNPATPAPTTAPTAKPSVPPSSASSSYEQYIANHLAEQKATIDAFMAQNTGGTMNYQQYQPVYSFQDNGMFLGDNYLQRAIDRDKWGGLKFKKGREMFMEQVEIYGCGQRIIQADQANSIWDSVARARVDCPTLTYIYNDEDGVRWETEVNELIIPFRVQNYKKITLNKQYFQNALTRTSRLRYDMMEQADGSFKKVPRNP